MDSEPDMIHMVRAKAAAAGPGARVQAGVAAEELRAEPGSFELIVLGNAFHRLKRERVACQACDWLQPGRLPRAVLHPYTVGGLLTETVQFACELDRRRG